MSHELNFLTDSMHLLATTRGLQRPQSWVTFTVREWEERRLQTAPLRFCSENELPFSAAHVTGRHAIGWLLLLLLENQDDLQASGNFSQWCSTRTRTHSCFRPVSLVMKSCWRPRRCRKIFWYLEKDKRKISPLLYRLRPRSRVSRYPVTIGNNGASVTCGFSSKRGLKIISVDCQPAYQ